MSYQNASPVVNPSAKTRLQHSLEQAKDGGGPSIGQWLALPGHALAKTVAPLGQDWVLIDCEHGHIDDHNMYLQISAISSSGVSPVVRIPADEPWMVKRALDAGAHAIMVPMCETKEQAERIVESAKYPSKSYPNGFRGTGAMFAPAAFNLTGRDYLLNANSNVMIFVQIESRKGVENVEEIASVGGIDMLFIGPNDLASSLGYVAFDHATTPEVQQATQRILKATLAAGKYAGHFALDAATAILSAAIVLADVPKITLGLLKVLGSICRESLSRIVSIAMYADISQPPPPLPKPRLDEVQSGISILAPLSRRGHGPGLIILVPDSTPQLTITEGVPSLILKWAEEGYTVVEIQASALTAGADAVASALDALKSHDRCDSHHAVGLIAYGPELWNRVAAELSRFPSIVGAGLYGDSEDIISLSAADIPVVQHLAGASSNNRERTAGVTRYYYPAVSSSEFAIPFQTYFHYNSEGISHSRTLRALKPLMGGPYFDLEAIWEEHTHYEFTDRSMEHTMSTMVQEPYVNHIPTLTGGIGREKLSRFYRDNFIFNNSTDTVNELISRTVGIDRVIDEFMFKFTHNQEVDWLLPGVPPTGLKAEVPFTAVVSIRGDRLHHEHISWDQGTLLKQLGLLPDYLPYPYPVRNGKATESHKRYEYRVPVLGVETAGKLRDKNSVPSNELFGFKIREV
ncbi:hypothetical protein FSARC_3961 [Fusarium sarcochroum]|uniref:HpcH/HpaI aldolase/citrate lyase domain-containing protein n=1 Tax=Fusarium sarcochroum TaxID=1208366 RepID=A0A8H4XBV3_9HYPO|nr:hypothetical protein FSARC_3961 [Fusarium sarcochroum]